MKNSFDHITSTIEDDERTVYFRDYSSAKKFVSDLILGMH